MKGHVYKRGKRWSYLFDIEPDPLTGKRRQANGSGYKTERGAWKACRAALADYETGRAASSSRRKVGDALKEWLTRIEHSIKPSMVQNWRNYAAYYVIPTSGNAISRKSMAPSATRCMPSCLRKVASRLGRGNGPAHGQFTRGGSRRVAGHYRVGRTAMTSCGVTGRTPRMTRR